jgi:hypothetical protein
MYGGRSEEGSVQATGSALQNVTRTALRHGMFRMFCWQARICRRLAFRSTSILSIAEACKRVC